MAAIRTIPNALTAGDTVLWSIDLPAYSPADGWALALYLHLAGAVVQTLESAPSPTDPNGHEVRIAAAVTAELTPGDYRYVATVSNGTERYTVGSGVLKVLIDPANPPAGYDPRTHAEKGLAAVEAVLEGRLGDSIVEYEIDGVKAKHLPHADLLKLRGVYRGMVRRERGGSMFTFHSPERVF